MAPALHLLARFCAVSHELKSRSGRTFVLRPRHKVAFVLVAGCVAYLAAAACSLVSILLLVPVGRSTGRAASADQTTPRAEAPSLDALLAGMTDTTEKGNEQ